MLSRKKKFKAQKLQENIVDGKKYATPDISPVFNRIGYNPKLTHYCSLINTLYNTGKLIAYIDIPYTVRRQSLVVGVTKNKINILAVI